MRSRSAAPRTWRSPFAFALLDQGLSSGVNFALAVLAGRRLGPSGLGVVSIGFAAYLLGLGFQRALLVEPLIVLTSDVESNQRREQSRRALTISLAMGGAASSIMLLIGIVASQPLRSALLIFALWTPAVLVQDLGRALLFRDGKGSAAAVSEVVWLAFLGIFAAVSGEATEAGLVAVWGLGGATAAVIVVTRLRLVPKSIGESWSWWSGQAWPFARWLGLQGVANTISLHGVVFLVAAFLDASAVGGLRAIQALFAPVTLLAPAIGLFGLPEITRRVSRSTDAGFGFAIRLSALTTGLSGLYLAVFIVAGRTFLQTIFGVRFLQFTDLIVPTAAAQLFIAASVGFVLLLKAHRRGSALVITSSISAGATLLLALYSATVFGLLGVAWGLAVAACLSLIITLWFSIHDVRAVTGTEKVKLG